MTPSTAIALLALVALGADPARLEGPPALVVQAPSDVGASAKIAQRFAAALAARMPALRVVADGAIGPDDLQATLLPAGGRWTLSVWRAGRQVLERDLAAESGVDEAFLLACALVIERFLQGIEWAGKPASIDPDAVEHPMPALIPEPVLEPSTPLEWTIAAGPQGALALSPTALRIGPALEVMVRRARLLGGLRAHFYAPSSREIAIAPGWAGTASTASLKEWPLAIAALVGACWGERIGVCGGAQLGWRGTWASVTSGDLNAARSGRVDAFMAGIFGRVAIKLPYRLQARALVGAHGFAGSSFTVQDFHGQAVVEGPSRFEASLALELARELP